MNVTIVGAGAIGGLMAARLAANVPEVKLTLLARGQTLSALQANGLQLFEPDADRSGEHAKVFDAPVSASDDAGAIGEQDLVVISVKYNAMSSLASQLQPLIGPNTIVLSAMNGVPWWFTTGLEGAPANLALNAVDPGGSVSQAFPAGQVLGCVVHLAGSTRAPGQIQRNLGNRLIFGEPSRQLTDRLTRIADLFKQAKFDVDVSDNIHADIWFKLWGNMTMNPISAITGAWSDTILQDPLLRGYLSAVMAEAAQVGAKIGLPITTEPESRHQVTEKLGRFKTSMLQDVEAGKPLELDALVTVVREIATQVGVPTPHLDSLLGLSRVFAKSHQLN
ncbi:MAG: 2-dehydropantoate 2-reductase [Burkholderiaceae bacterium]